MSSIMIIINHYEKVLICAFEILDFCLEKDFVSLKHFPN